MKVNLKYFSIAIVFIGSIGIWLSMILEFIDKQSIDWHNVTPNLITYFSAIIFTGNIDYFMVLIHKKKSDELLSEFLNVVLISIVAILWVFFTIYSHMRKIDILAYIMSIIGILVSWWIWWTANKDNPNFQVQRKPEYATPNSDNLPGAPSEFKV